MVKSERVYQLSCSHLGDVWSSARHFLTESALGPPLRLSRWAKDAEGHERRVSTLDEIVSLFAADASLLKSTDERPTEPPLSFDLAFASPLIPTRRRWQGDGSRLVCYAFDGRYRAAEKNPTAEEARHVLTRLESLGFEAVDIGGRRYAITETVDLLSHSRCFVGPICGWHQVCLSTGTPAVAVYRGFSCEDMQRTHQGRVTLCADYSEMIDMLASSV